MREGHRFPSVGNQAREAGSVMLMAMLIVSLLAALSAAQFVVAVKNVRASTFFLDHADLRSYAESGVELALHDIEQNVSGNGGNIGTVNWVSASDVGRDGIAGTYDEGEADGFPTVGEPGVRPAPIGPTDFGAGLIVHVMDTAFPNVKRVTATATTGDVTATVQAFAKQENVDLPDVGALYVDPGVVLDFRSGAYRIDGHDHDLDGSVNSDPGVWGVATCAGDPVGLNSADLLAQIPFSQWPQIRGEDGPPSVGEEPLDFDSLFDTVKSLHTQTLAPGTYTSPDLGDTAEGDFRVTYAEGDVHLSGGASGAGVLVVEGSLTLTGHFSFQGLVIVRGDFRVSGSSSEIKVLGALMVGETVTNEDISRARGSGGTAIYYSSAALKNAEKALNWDYSLVYYSEQ